MITPSGSGAARAPPRRPPGRCLRCTRPASAREAVARGVQWLVDTQREDGGWDEPQYTGTGFPSDYYINYHLYRLVFPVMALGRCLSGRAPMMQTALLELSTPANPERAGGDGAGLAARTFPSRRACSRARDRRHLLAVYGFARLADELGDELTGDRLAALDWLEGEVDRAYAGNARHPLLVRLQPTLAECALPREPLVRLIDANRLDQRSRAMRPGSSCRPTASCRPTRSASWCCACSGWQAPSGSRCQTACAPPCSWWSTCRIWARTCERGRMYLPAQDLARFDCSHEQLRELVRARWSWIWI